MIGEEIIWLQIQVSIAVVAVLLLRFGMKKMPKIYTYFLCILVFARLLCPVSVESKFSIMPSKDAGVAWVEEVLAKASAGEVIPGSAFDALNGAGAGNMGEGLSGAEAGSMGEAMNGAEAGSLGGNMSSAEAGSMGGAMNGAGAESPGGNMGGATFGIKRILLLVWVMGVVAILGYNGAALAVLRKKLQGARLLEDENVPVYISERIFSPFTLGLLQPKIYLPASLAEEEQVYILAHEQVHIRRKDYFVKNLAFLLTAIYWFNPFVWVAFFFLERDMEMSCDEKVIKLLGTEIKRNYSQSLLNFAAGKGGMAVTPLTFGENNVKQRVKNVLTYKSVGKWSVAVGVVLLLTGAVVLFTTGQSGNEESGKDREQEVVNEGDTASDIFWTEEVVFTEGEETLKYTLQARKDGIYRLQNDTEECIYPYPIVLWELWDIDDGILYFFTDTTYREGKLDYADNAIVMVDIKTGQYDMTTLSMSVSELIPFLIDCDEMIVNGGWITLNDRDRNKSYSRSLLNTGESAVLIGNYWQGKAVSELNEQEQDAYGAWVRKQLLENGEVLRLSNREKKDTYALVDLDGDGKAERITLSRNPEPLTDLYWTYGSFDKYKLDVNGSALTGELEGTGNDIYAFCPDGKNIVLALSAVNAEGQYQTVLYSYAGGQLKELGILPIHISGCGVVDGYFGSWVRFEEFFQPCRIFKFWCINKEGLLEEVLQDSYQLSYSNLPLPNLLLELPVHDTPGGEEIHYIQPQSVDFVRISDDFLWIYLEAEDGSSGWFQIETKRIVENDVPKLSIDIVELDMNYTEVFELFYAG